MQVSYEVKELPARHVAYLRHVGPYNEVGEAFGRLFQWAGARGLLRFPATESLAVYHDDPESTDVAQLRSDACITVPPDTAVDGDIQLMDIPGGLFAVGHFEIEMGEFKAAWDKVVAEFIPASGYAPDDRPCYEQYLNDPATHPEHKWLVDICEPVRPLT
jgi:AraC family transcriptional regulator